MTKLSNPRVATSTLHTRGSTYPSTLYLCYFGLREPLVQTQVLPYLRQLVTARVRVNLLTFEPEPLKGLERAEWYARLKEDGITWRSLAYHKRPSLIATTFDIAAGAWVAARWSRCAGIDVLHARSHVAAAIGALASKLCGARLIFDIRGIMAEEYVDAGVWKKNSLAFRLTKAVERKLLKVSDGFVVLTEKAQRILFTENKSTKPIAVIPCCVDVQRFEYTSAQDREQIRTELGVTARKVLVYTGALGGWYLTDEMVDFLTQAYQQDATTFALILTQSPAPTIAERLRAVGLKENDFLVRQVPPVEIPRYLRAADVAISFIKPCYSKLFSSPTKIAEYLISGLPVISNAGIGDVDEVIQQDRVGVLVHEFSEKAYADALQRMATLQAEGDIVQRCRESARKRFDLVSVGGARYVRLYRQMLCEEDSLKEPVVALSFKHDE